MRKFYGLAILVCLASCTVTSYDGSILVINQSGIEVHDVTFSGDSIEVGSVYIYPAGTAGKVTCKTPSGYLYTFPIDVSISIREHYRITIYGDGAMREEVPTLYARIQTY